RESGNPGAKGSVVALDPRLRGGDDQLDSALGAGSSIARALGGMADVAALLGDAGLLVADPGKAGDAFADFVLGRRAEAQPETRFGGLAIARPFRPRVEGDAGVERGLDEFPHIDLVGQFQP